MRFFEIASKKRVPLSTNRFDKEITAAMDNAPSVRETLREFLLFRETALPQDGFGKKDAPFTAGILKGYRHVHLVFGRIIAVYDVTGDAVRLYCVGVHKDFDGMTPPVAAFLKNVTAADFHPFTLLDERPVSLDREQVQAIIDALYDLASNPTDRPMLVDMVETKHADPTMMEYICAVTDLTAEQIGQAFGGAAGFLAKVAEVLKNCADPLDHASGVDYGI